MAAEQAKETDPVNLPFDEIPYCDLSPEGEWQRVGKGSFGSVWRAQYLGLDVAVKEIFDSDDYDTKKYFERESVLLQECRHPNICLYLGLCMAPPSPKPDRRHTARQQRILIVSEFCTNGNLRSHIASNEPFPWRARISFAVDLARAVAYLHARGCMHRDLKPDNILVTDNGRLKLCDFGFARIKPRNDYEQRRLSYCGSDDYMSPEILLYEHFDLSSDIFSLGRILCEIISRTLADEHIFARELPSQGVDANEIARRAEAGCPLALTTLAMECVATDPNLRPDARRVLKKLMAIEADYVRTEQPQLASHIGSVKYISTISSKSAMRLVPRMPSFEGQVVIAMSQLSVRPSLAKLGIGRPPPGGIFSLANGPINGDAPYDDGELDLKRVENANTTDSMRTIRVSPPRITRRRKPARNFTDDSIPSVPSEWLREAAERGQAKESSSSSDDSEPETPAAEEASPSFLTARTSSTVADDGRYMHRFSLVRPVWLRMLFGGRAHPGADKCNICIKKLGTLAHFLCCDDCGFLAHSKCADAASFDCPGAGSNSDEAIKVTLIPKKQLKVRPRS